MRSAVVFVLLLLAMSVQASTKHHEGYSAEQWNQQTSEVIDSFNTAYTPYDEKAVIDRIRSQEKTRRPATQDMVDTDIQKVSNDLWNCKTGVDFANFLQKYDPRDQQGNVVRGGSFDHLSVPAQVMLLHITPIRAFRGFLWKAKGLFEHNSKFLQSRAVTKIRNIAASLSIRLPDDDMYADALVDYIAAPYSGDDGTGTTAFVSETHMQQYLIVHLGRELLNSQIRLQNLAINAPFAWDNKVFYGANSFRDGIRRFTYYGELEKNASMAAFFIAMHHLSVMGSYNIDGTLSVLKEVGHLFGFDMFKNSVSGFSQVDGVTKIDVANTIRKNSPKLFGTLIVDDGKGHSKRMKSALRCAKYANDYIQTIWRATGEMKMTPDDEFIQAGYFNIRRERKGHNVLLLNEMYNVKLDGDNITPNPPVAVKSLVTNDVAHIDIGQLYLNPPQDLKAFLPLTGRSNVKKYAAGLEYRDYFEGIPNHWNSDAYRTYFPGAGDDNGIRSLKRVLAEAGGLWVVEEN